MSSWQALDDEVARWRDAGRDVELWWRDDDATDTGAALDRLLALAARDRGAAGTRRRARRVPRRHWPSGWPPSPAIDVLQHGYAHANHALPPDKKSELGPHRPAMLVLGELGTGRMALERLFATARSAGAGAALEPHRARRSFRLCRRSASAACRPSPPGAAPSRFEACGRSTRTSTSSTGKTGATLSAMMPHVAALVEALRQSRSATSEPVGVLSHHLAMDEGAWDFLRSILGKGNKIAGCETMLGARLVRVTGGARLSSADLRYPRQTLWADYIRAGAGVLCAVFRCWRSKSIAGWR